MAEIVATFNTKDKTLSVEMDGKKIKDVSELHAYIYGDMAGVELRRIESNEEDGITVITKVIANEDGEPEISEKECKSSVTEDLAKLLLPRKNLTGV